MEHGDQQDMLLLSEAQQRCAKEWPLLQIEDPLCSGSCFFEDFLLALGFRCVAQVQRVKPGLELWQDFLKQVSIARDQAWTAPTFCASAQSMRFEG